MTMETHYNPSNTLVRRRLRRARSELASTQSLERETGVPLIENQPASEHLQAALDMLFSGLQSGDMDFVAFGVAMVQDVELRLRCADGMAIAREEAVETIHRIQAWARKMGKCKAPSPLVPAAHGVIEGMRHMMGNPDPDSLVRALLRQCAKSEKVTAWREAQANG